MSGTHAVICMSGTPVSICMSGTPLNICMSGTPLNICMPSTPVSICMPTRTHISILGLQPIYYIVYMSKSMISNVIFYNHE